MGDYYKQLIFHAGFGVFALGAVGIYNGQRLGYVGLLAGLIAIFVGIILLRDSDED